MGLIHTFSRADSIIVPVGYITNAEVLIVAGGGGGGYRHAGGGGAGGLIHDISFKLNTTKSVMVGNGGLGSTDPNTSSHGVNGAVSSIGKVSANGGGGGSNDGQLGQIGGSGGGGSNGSSGGAGISGQGFKGGNQNNGQGCCHAWGAGGGGFSAPGANTASDSGSVGGLGISLDISGISVFYAGGGGGGNLLSDTAYPGGKNSGGKGGYGISMNGENGVINTGGGGGGGGGSIYGSSGNGGNGGSGIVIIKYVSSPGVWTSQNSSIASVDAAGIVTGVQNGSVDITYTISNGTRISSYVQTVTVSDAPPLNVTVNKKNGQESKTTSPVMFTAVFSLPINIASFTVANIILSGTATNKSIAALMQVAPNDGTTFDITVTEDNNGTVAASIPAASKITSTGIALEGSNTPSNAASTSTNNSYVLPVKLLYFTSISKDCKTALSWQTASELNSSYYGIEYSRNGIEFLEAAKLISKNNLTGASYNYTFKELASGTYYYRLKMVDVDGNYTYSKIVAITASANCGTGNWPTVSPNPAIDFVTVAGLVKGQHLSLINAGGVLLNLIEATSSTQQINISTYASGIYMLRVEAADGSIRTLKFVKK